MITREVFCASELDVAGDDAEKFFDWLNRAGLLQFAPGTGWRWEDRAEAAPNCPMDVLDLWAQFREEV